MSWPEGSRTLVTGAGSGIGREIAVQFAARGSTVVVADLDVGAGESTVEQIELEGGNASFYRVDVSEADEVDRLVSSLGGLDQAINCAAIDPEVYPEPEWDLAVLDRIWSVNLRGLAVCVKAEIAAMRASGGGAIVNLTSLAGVTGVSNKPFYSAIKHGVVGLTRAAAVGQARHGIRINAIAPGFIETPMALANVPDPGQLEAVVARNPTGRIGQPKEIAEAALYLCSPAAGFTVGQVLSVDGGVTVGR